MNEFSDTLGGMAAILITVFAFAGLVLMALNIYRLGIAHRKELERRAGLLPQLDQWEAKENQKAKELNGQLKEIGRG